jgi:hypothetical protein
MINDAQPHHLKLNRHKVKAKRTIESCMNYKYITPKYKIKGFIQDIVMILITKLLFLWAPICRFLIILWPLSFVFEFWFLNPLLNYFVTDYNSLISHYLLILNNEQGSDFRLRKNLKNVLKSYLKRIVTKKVQKMNVKNFIYHLKITKISFFFRNFKWKNRKKPK